MSVATLVEYIDHAIVAHSAWKFRLGNAIASGKPEIEPGIIRCDDNCTVGQWLVGRTLDTETKASVPYHVVKRLHADFHKSAAEVLECVISGKSDQASALLDGEFTDRSDKLLRALNKWKRELTSTSR